ncbi:MAG: hypothetical protein ACYC3X_15350 [Pirellulaceae bacterium]
MADDLEAFLRQAAQRRVQRNAAPPRPVAAPPPPPPPAPPRAPLTPPTSAAPPPPKVVPSKVAPARVVPAKVVSAPEPTRLGTRMNTAGVGQHAAHLGEEIELADDHMEAHLTQKFDHQIGSKGMAEAGDQLASSGEPTLDLESLAAMLKNPTSIRHAVVLNEILTRPRFD